MTWTAFTIFAMLIVSNENAFNWNWSKTTNVTNIPVMGSDSSICGQIGRSIFPERLFLQNWEWGGSLGKNIYIEKFIQQKYIFYDDMKILDKKNQQATNKQGKAVAVLSFFKLMGSKESFFSSKDTIEPVTFAHLEALKITRGWNKRLKVCESMCAEFPTSVVWTMVKTKVLVYQHLANTLFLCLLLCIHVDWGCLTTCSQTLQRAHKWKLTSSTVLEVLQITKKVLQLTSLTPPWSLLSAAHILDVIFPGTRFQGSISSWQLGFLSEGALSPTPS